VRRDPHGHVRPPAHLGYRREDFIETKQVLMERSRVVQERGRDALMEDLLARTAIAEAKA